MMASMIEELDVYRAAKVLVDHHGDDARAHAMERFEAFRAAGNDQAVALWFRIICAIEAIQLPEAQSTTQRQ
jgi:hypothetical protein